MIDTPERIIGIQEAYEQAIKRANFNSDVYRKQIYDRKRNKGTCVYHKCNLAAMEGRAYCKIHMKQRNSYYKRRKRRAWITMI